MTTRREFLAQAAVGVGATLGGFIAPSASASNARFSVSDGKFVLDGKPFQVLAGEMHYPRIPRQLWRDRMHKLKSLGLNTLSTYVFWNAHEPRRGRYDFSGNLDVVAFIRMAQEEGLWVNLRPSPYACAEWDGGGIPAWVLADPTIPPRSLDERYMQPVEAWLQRLGREVTPLLISNGGPIILTQVENEYGSYGADAAYMRANYRALLDAGFDGVFYTADGAAVMSGGAVPELPAGVNFGTYDRAENEFATRAKVRTDGPFFCAELWGGWFDHFGETHSKVDIPPLLASLEWMLQRGYSLSFYMLHGGTSFGFTAGANYPEGGSYQPDISSYDYDAILDEAGRPTAKYEAVKALFARYLPPERFAPLPAPEQGVEIARFRLHECAHLTQLLASPVRAEHPRTLEALGQNHGLMLYRHRPRKHLSGKLRLGEVRDYALVSAAGELLGALDRRFAESTIDVTCSARASLDVLVDTMGHINYGPRIGKDQKGLIGIPMLDDTPLIGWDHYGLPLDDLSGLRFARKPVPGPAFYRGTFRLPQQGYTFLDLRGWGKGYVWVNGHNLGRYWSVGPQRALFVPAPWLNAGENEVIVLDLHSGAERTLAGGTTQIWDVTGAVKA
jgi:beta-galactosidase